MELLTILICEGHLCPRCPPFQRAGVCLRNAPPFRRPWCDQCAWVNSLIKLP